jgi:DNA-binding transcriptional regulator YiaG
MGQVLHGSARTTEAIRRAIQHSEASLRALSKRYGINQKTVAKWKRRTSEPDRFILNPLQQMPGLNS